MLKLGQLMKLDATMASKCSNEKKKIFFFFFFACLSLNQKLEMTYFSEKGVFNAYMGQKLGLLYQTVSQFVNTKEKFSKEI